MSERSPEDFSAPAPLTHEHDLSQFSSGKPGLDDWLRNRALHNEGRFARTYVVCRGKAVVGYHAMATGAVRREGLPKKSRRNAPDTVPIVLIARLAVDERFQGRGIGRGLLKDALGRALQLSGTVGCRAVLVHAIDDEAAGFYAAFGFQAFPAGSGTYFMPMETIVAAL